MHKEAFKYQDETLHFKLGHYENDVLAVQIFAGKVPYATISVNLDEIPAEGAFWLKSWTENEELAMFLVKEGLIELTGRAAEAGLAIAYEARLTQKGLTASLKKDAATYDSKETDEIMTKQLSEREDYGVGVFPHHDYPENSSDVRPKTPPVHQQELWNRFKEWWDEAVEIQEEKNRVGREKGKNSPSRGEQVGNQGEGFWAYKNTPYVAPTQSPGFFMAMPAMKEGSLNKEAIDQYGDHNVSATFEFMQDQIRVECTWDSRDLPRGLTEAQTLARVVQFLDSKLPDAYNKFRHAKVEDLDLPNRTITLVIPLGE